MHAETLTTKTKTKKEKKKKIGAVLRLRSCAPSPVSQAAKKITFEILPYLKKNDP